MKEKLEEMGVKTNIMKMMRKEKLKLMCHKN